MASAEDRQIWHALQETKTPLHWSTRQEEIKQQQRDAEIDRVTCTCDTCMFWSAGDKCVAESISLSKKPDQDLGMVVICETFVAADSGEDEDGDEGPLPGEGYGLHGQRPTVR